MITSTKKKLLMATLVTSLGFAGTAFAQETFKDIVVAGKGEIPYVIDARNVIVRSGYGLCWRTGFWTPALAETTLDQAGIPLGCHCDPEVVGKEKCEPPRPPEPLKPPQPCVDEGKTKLNADNLFDFNKATLRPAGKAELDKVVSKAQGMKLEAVVVVGHTDRLGSDKYNQALSERRAAAVKSYLVSKGLNASQIYTEGKGERMPTKETSKCTMKPESSRNSKLVACLQPDRRVEINVVGGGKSCK